MKRSLGYLTLALGGLLAVNAGAQTPWTNAYTSPTKQGDCAGLPAAIATDTSLFSIQPIISRAIFADTAVGVTRPARITKLAFWLNPVTQKADIFVGERGRSIAQNGTSPSRIQYYNASANPPTMTIIGTFTSSEVFAGFNEAGIYGLAVNPMTFAQDNFLYVMYASGSGSSASATTGWRVSRFKLHPTTRMMDKASEKILMHIPAGNTGRWHTGTSMRFDNFGNLYIGTGDNEATAMGPGNTADYRGGILRIKPDSTNPRGYTIPAGNFGDYWGKRWADSGLAARAAAYRDTAVVKPEIYIKGSRNPYVFGLDPHRLGWIAWGECGPDFAGERGEDHNFSTKPAFSGWPFWVGTGTRQSQYANDYNETPEPTGSAWASFNYVGMSTQVPVNNWPQALGYDTLPPNHTPYATQASGCAMGGPIIRYDGRINNPGKLPPHLNNVILTTNYATVYASAIDTTAGVAGAAATVFTMSKLNNQPSLRNQSEMVQGPDGVLYVVDQSETCCGSRALNSTEGVAKVVYKGTCQDPGLVPVAIASPSKKNLARFSGASWLRVGSTSFSITAPGPHQAEILDVGGRVLHDIRGEGHKTYNIPKVGSGIHVLRVTTPSGIVTSPLASGL
jgi:hypothetical protein